MRRLPIYRFLVLWAGQLVSGLGTGMTGFALGVHVFNRTGSAAGFGLVVAALFGPSILLRPIGGVLADRLDRRVLIIAGDLASAAAVGFLLVSLARGELTLLRIYIGVALGSASQAVQSPAYKASISDVLGAKDFAKAGGMMQLASAAQHLLSPLAAGLLLATAGLGVILIIDVATFGFAVAAVLSLRARAEVYSASGAARSPGRGTDGRATEAGGRRISPLRELGDGLRALRANGEALEMVLVISLVTFFVGLLQTLFAPMMLSLTDSKTLGVVQSVSASGMIASSLLIGALGTPFTPRKTTMLGLSAAGVFLVLLGTSTNIVWITVSFFAFFLCLPLVNTGAEVAIRTAIPNEFQGRVWGTVGLLSQLGYITAYLSAGALADALFTPLLMPQGALAQSVGRVFGVGPGRGIAFMLSLAGIGLTLTAALASARAARALRGPRGPLQNAREEAYQS